MLRRSPNVNASTDCEAGENRKGRASASSESSVEQLQIEQVVGEVTKTAVGVGHRARIVCGVFAPSRGLKTQLS